MDFLIFLLIAGIMFYFSKIEPERKKALAQSQDNSVVPQQNPSRTTTRPTVPPLYGIEISANQQRRLGKNDPSVIAANLAKTSQTPAWLDEIKHNHFEDLFAGKKHYPALSLFLDRLFQPKK